MSCHKRFSGGQKLNPNTLWQRYSEGKQTATQLAAQYGCSIKTIHRYLSKAATQAECALSQAPVNLTWTPPISAENGASWSSTTLAASAP